MVRKKRSRSGFSQNSVLNITNKDSSSSNTSKKKAKPAKKQCIMIGTKLFTVTVKTMREVRKLQLTTALLIPKLSFARVVKEVMMEYMTDVRIQKEALEALQEAAEAYMVQLFEDSYLCALHSKRITLFPKDLKLALRLRGQW